MNLLKKTVVFLLTLQSRLIISKYKPFIIVVTGSVGKTSTKDAIYGVLKNQSAYVRKSDKSMNSEIGLPITVIGVPNAWKSLQGWTNNLIEGFKLILKKNEYPDTLILEIGADHPGDIKKVVKWLRADIVVITQVSDTPVHVEFFSSPDEVFEEKASLADALKNDGVLVLFGDNKKIMTIADRVKDKNAKIISFGTVEEALVKASDYHVTYADSVPIGFGFGLRVNNTTRPVYLKGIIGKTYIYPLLAASAVGQAKNIPIETIIKGLNSYEAPKGRMNIISGRQGSTLIDDTYNSSPDAVISALNTIKDLECSGSKIAVLGDMMELGQYSSDQHRAIGREVMGAVDTLITVGQRSRATADEALKAGMSPDSVHSFDKALEAAQYLSQITKLGDIILIKGSQSMRMERVVSMLMSNPEQAGRLLVRQEPEWLDKK